MKTFESLDQVFNTIPTVSPVEKVDLIKENINQEDNDFELARSTLRNLISKNEDVIDNIISLAKSSETPRTFEVAGQLLKTQSEMAKDLMELHKQKKDIEKEEPKKIGTQNNVVFAGSTADIMKLLNGENPKIIDAE